MKKHTCTKRTESVTALTLWDALTEAVLAFRPHDAVVSLGDAYCPVSEIATWMATQPVVRTSARRYVIGHGTITDLTTDDIASHFITVDMIPARIPVRQDGTARLRLDEATFLFAIESRRFLMSTGAWDRTGRVRPVALHEDGMEFEDIPSGAAS